MFKHSSLIVAATYNRVSSELLMKSVSNITNSRRPKQ